MAKKMTEKEIRKYLGKIVGEYQYYMELSAMLTGRPHDAWMLYQKDTDIIYKIFNAGYELGEKRNSAA